MKTLRIIAVRTIFQTEKPVVVFETAGGKAILRAPKLALIDLQNSGRALTLPADCLNNGLANLHPAQKQVFIQALLRTKGADLTGDITDVKAGDKYAVSKGHPALTDPNHKDFGKVKKEGDELVAEKDGTWINGFLDIPFTDKEMMRQDLTEVGAISMLAMFGFNAPIAPVSISQQETEDIEHSDVPMSEETKASIEAFSKETK